MANTKQTPAPKQEQTEQSTQQTPETGYKLPSGNTRRDF